MEGRILKNRPTSAFPNPLQNELTVDFSDIRGTVTNIALMDASGSKKILEKVNTDMNQHLFNLQNYPSGVYIIMVYRKNLPPVHLKVVKTS